MTAANTLVQRMRDYAALVRLSHSVFALPFALLSLLVATGGRPSLRLLALVVLAVVAARTAAMAYNRFADRDLDRRNPRTAGREIPRGAVASWQALALTGIAALVFVATCRALSPLCFWLSLPTLAWLLAYSHVKRFSAACHLWLGVALGCSPVAAWVAADGAFGPRLLAPTVLGVGVAAWVAGFDVLYACQDEQFDRGAGLHSLPARLGARGAMWCSRLLHVGAAGAFAAFGLLAALGPAYHVGVALALVLMVWQHALLRPDDLSRIQTAFFTANGLIAIGLFGATCLDLYLFAPSR